MLDDSEDEPLTVVEHLNEVRKRVIVSVVSFATATVICFPLTSWVFKGLKYPAGGMIKKLVFFSPQEAFVVFCRVAIFCGLLLSMPVILYQIWAFISPAFAKKNKRAIVYYVVFCSLLFIAGALFAYFVLIPPALKFLLSFGSEEMEPMISVGKYTSFVVGLMGASGVMFQMPFMSVVLTKLGFINHILLRKKYKYAVVAICIVSAMITPTQDVLNLLLFVCPMLLLYEISIWLSYYFRKEIEIYPSSPVQDKD